MREVGIDQKYTGLIAIKAVSEGESRRYMTEPPEDVFLDKIRNTPDNPIETIIGFEKGTCFIKQQ